MVIFSNMKSNHLYSKTLILIKCTNFDPYLMAMPCEPKGINWFSLRQNLRLLLTLFESKPHIIIIFRLKTNKQKPEKHHVNGSQTRRVIPTKEADRIAIEPRHEKTNILVSDLVRHKPGCTATEDG